MVERYPIVVQEIDDLVAYAANLVSRLTSKRFVFHHKNYISFTENLK